MFAMIHLLAQVATDGFIEVFKTVGWPGVVLLFVMRGMERIERAMEQFAHSNKGLSMAIWMELASRPHADPFFKAAAQREINKMEAAQQVQQQESQRTRRGFV